MKKVVQKTMEELREDAQKFNYDLDYIPETLIENIYEAGEAEWQRSMRQGIGSSSAGAAIGHNEYKSRTEVILEKARGRAKPIGAAAGDYKMQYILDCGHMMEAALLKWYAYNLGYVCALVDPRNPSTSEIKDVSEITQAEWNAWKGKGVIATDRSRKCHPNYPFMYTDMDGIAFYPEDDFGVREMYVVECKTSQADGFIYDWKTGVWPDARVKHVYYIDQARQHMAVANCNRCDIIAACDFNSDHIQVVTVYRDIAQEVNLINQEKKLWDDYQKGIIPSYSGLSKSSYENMVYIMSEDLTEEKPLDIGDKAQEKLSKYFKTKNQMDEFYSKAEELQEECNRLATELIPLMQGHKEVIADNIEGDNERMVKIKLEEKYSSSGSTERMKLADPEGYAYCNKLQDEYKKLIIEENKQKGIVNISLSIKDLKRPKKKFGV